MTLPKHDAKSREAAAQRDHFYVGDDGILHQRVRLTEEEADAATLTVYTLTGRRYRRYLCRKTWCGGWHIRPCSMRPKDFARWAERHVDATDHRRTA